MSVTVAESRSSFVKESLMNPSIWYFWAKAKEDVKIKISKSNLRIQLQLWLHKSLWGPRCSRWKISRETNGGLIPETSCAGIMVVTKGGVFHGSTYYYDPIKALEWLAKYAFQTFLDMLSAIIDGHNDWYGHCCHRLVFLVRLCHSPFFADDTKKYWCLWLGRGVLLSVRCFRFLLYRKDRAKWFNMQGFGLFFSLFFLICGLSAIFLGFAWRRTGKCLPLQSFYSIM